MTDLPLDQMKAALDAATPGEWDACEPGDYGDFDGNSRVICSADPDDMRRIAVVHWYERYPETEANAKAITLLHNNARALIAAARERDALRELLREAKGLIEGLEGQFDHAGCTCTFPTDECCSYGRIDTVVARIDTTLEGSTK